MSEPLKLTPSLRVMLERIERHSGELLELSVTASGGRECTKLQRLFRSGYVVRVDHPTVKARKWPAEALAITEAGKNALAGREDRLNRTDIPASATDRDRTDPTRYSGANGTSFLMRAWL
jgi:hypothetical protein